GHAAGLFDLPSDQLAHVLQVYVARHELGEGVGNGDDRLLEVFILHAGRAPQGTGAGHVAAVGGRLGTVIRHGYCLVMRGAGWGLAYQFAARAAALAARRRPRGESSSAVNCKSADLGTIGLRQQPRPLQMLLEYLRVALVVVQRGPLLWQPLHRAGLEAAFAEPVGGAGGEHEQGAQPQPARLGFDVLQQLVAAPAMTVIRMDGHAGQFGAVLVQRIERGTTDDHAVALDQGALVYFRFQHLAGTPDPDAR